MSFGAATQSFPLLPGWRSCLLPSFGSTNGVDIHDIHPKTRQHSKTVRHCIGNILELEVKEDLLALFLQIGNNGRAFTVKSSIPTL